MKITAKTKYAMIITMDVARHAQGRLVGMTEVANRQKISQSFTEQILTSLRAAGLLNAKRGTNGGFSMAKPLSEINVLDIIHAVGEKVELWSGECKGSRTAEAVNAKAFIAALEHVIKDGLSVSLSLEAERAALEERLRS